MNTEKKSFAGMKKRNVSAAALALLLAGGAVGRLAALTSPVDTNTEMQTMTTQGNKFYCNIKALNPVERARHKQLTDKLIAARKEIVETERGYEFQFSPATVSLADLADWVAAEGKCCPFFDFHIDLKREASLLCLRLTGDEGIKAFIRTEFQVPPSKYTEDRGAWFLSPGMSVQSAAPQYAFDPV
jgi:hypothetical protein